MNHQSYTVHEEKQRAAARPHPRHAIAENALDAQYIEHHFFERLLPDPFGAARFDAVFVEAVEDALLAGFAGAFLVLFVGVFLALFVGALVLFADALVLFVGAFLVLFAGAFCISYIPPHIPRPPCPWQTGAPCRSSPWAAKRRPSPHRAESHC